ncbi:MAG: hypothetical protein CL887_07165 [Dehalococcoidia bacterium]|nr:hypothetical protein [Dehalococcoidia bacterium]
MFDLPGWLLVIPILGFLVFIHELGHFLCAKKFNIKVTEFGFGFPPRLYGFRYGETLYSINLIPIGGFVKMVGEEDPTDPRSFANQSVIARIIVLSAGSFMNVIVPIVIFTTLLILPHDTISGEVTIGGIAPQSPAQISGLREGDVILKIDDIPVNNHTELIESIKKSRGEPTKFLVRRTRNITGIQTSPEFSSTEVIELTPRTEIPKLKVVTEVSDSSREVSLNSAKAYQSSLKIGDTLTQGSVGILIGTLNPKITQQQLGIWDAVSTSIEKIFLVVTSTFSGVTNWISEGNDPGFAGPIGIAQVTDQVAEIGIAPVFELMALISISLAIVNMLPIPDLDGGRLLFVLIEAIRGGKRISPKTEGFIHMAGFAVLIALIILMSYIDITRIITGESLIN